MDEYDKSTKIKHGCWTPNIFFKKNLETNGNIHQRDREHVSKSQTNYNYRTIDCSLQ